MANEHDLGPLAQVPPGEGRVFKVAGREVAIFHTRDRGEVYATQSTCPHLGGPLADGLIGSGTLVCPLHDIAFDMSTGIAANADCRIAVYPARLDGDQRILVTIDD